MKYIETRHLTTAKVRRLCIKNNWYTCGDNEEYAAMFAKLHDEEGNLVHMTADKLFEIAEDIYAHSEITDYSIEAVVCELARNCLYFFDEI